MSSDIAIRITNLSKCYQIYDNPRNRLKQFVLPRVKHAFGRQSCNYYREFWALKNVSFEIKKGETVGIIGQNGSGKSTLLQMICGTLNPTSGSIETHGRIAALLELGSGFNPEFTGRENVYMNAAVLGLSKEETDARFDDIAAFADIGDFIERPVKTYSSGMYVRLAFAVAIHVTPDILIVDEALGVGDIRFQAKCMRAIQEIKEKGSAILFVTHSPGQIEALCDRVVWLNDGELKADGFPKNLMRRYVNFMMHGLDEKDSDATDVMTVSEKGRKKNIEADPCQWTEITSRNNIKGDLSAVITKIMAQQLNGERLSIIQAKTEKINIAFTIKAHADVLKPILAVGVFNTLNEPIVHFNTENAETFINPLPANTHHTFKFTFDVPSLRPGEYLISIGIDDGILGASTVLCHVYDAWSFIVIPCHGQEAQGGYIQIEDIKEALKHIKVAI
jgi:lipopolysaccharide transport system ATP-binding protein